MTLIQAQYGAVRRIPGRITARTIRNETGDVVGDASSGYPRFCKYNAAAGSVDTANQKVERVDGTDLTPIGGRPTDDDVEIQYASVGDPCEFHISGPFVSLIVCTEKILFRACGSETPIIPGPIGSAIVETA